MRWLFAAEHHINRAFFPRQKLMGAHQLDRRTEPACDLEYSHGRFALFEPVFSQRDGKVDTIRRAAEKHISPFPHRVYTDSASVYDFALNPELNGIAQSIESNGLCPERKSIPTISKAHSAYSSAVLPGAFAKQLFD